MPERLENALLKLGWRPPKRGVVVEAQDPAAPAPIDIGHGAPVVRHFRVALGDVYANKKFELEGTFLWCVKTSMPGCYCRVAFNEQNPSGGIPFYEGMQISGHPFSRLYITNPVSQTPSGAHWMEFVASSIPLDTKQPVSDRGPVLYSVRDTETSANSADVRNLLIENYAASYMYRNEALGYPAVTPFEVWLQNSPEQSTDYMHWAIRSQEFGAGPIVDPWFHTLDIGETVILPYVPYIIEIVSANVATAVTGNAMIVFQSAA